MGLTEAEDIKKRWREYTEEKIEPRWQRNRTGRPLSPLQIHRKNNSTQSKLHKQLLIAS